MTTHGTPSIPPRPPRRLRTTAGGHRDAQAHERPGRLARARRAIQQLAPETIEHIAKRVAQLLREEPPAPAVVDADSTADAENPTPGLITASQLAERLGVSRAWVYEHARKLGAITLGDGPKARLRFDLQRALQALDATPSQPEQTSPAEPPRRPRGRPRRAPAPTVPLIPVRPPRPRGLLARLVLGGWRRS